MKILLDHCVPQKLRAYLSHHTVSTAQEMGWAMLKNGELLREAEKEFQLFLTTDKNLRYQQNLKQRSIAIVVMMAYNNRVGTLSLLIPKMEAILPTIQPGDLYEIV